MKLRWPCNFSIFFFQVSYCLGSRQWLLGGYEPFPGRISGASLISNDTPSDGRLFTPFEDLSFLSSTQHTVLTHPRLPNHSVRIKKSHDFCDPTVNSYTGYIDVEARHLFFYFFESRNDPDSDDLILWTNGGPGCSSTAGLFMELGPCSLKDGNTTVFNPYSWNTNANIFFIDQPVNVGFSYADYGEEVGNSEEAAQDIANFLVIFIEHFSKFKGRALHMAGESYGGRYLPVFASEIYDRNPLLVEAGLTPINLQSVLTVNGLTDTFTQIFSGFSFGCEQNLIPPFLSIEKCLKLKTLIPRCKEWVKTSCIDRLDNTDCNFAAEYCLGNLWDFYWAELKKNPYDIRRECEGEIGETMCYADSRKNIHEYLDNPQIRQTLGVDPYFANQNYSDCNIPMHFVFFKNLDHVRPTTHYVSALLERGIRVLAIVGNYDWLCNWIGVDTWTRALEWSGQDEFNAQKLRDWEVDGKAAGVVRSFGGFTFATIDGAGHMAPFDKPKESLALLQRWLAKENI